MAKNAYERAKYHASKVVSIQTTLETDKKELEQLRAEMVNVEAANQKAIADLANAEQETKNAYNDYKTALGSVAAISTLQKSISDENNAYSKLKEELEKLKAKKSKDEASVITGKSWNKLESAAINGSNLRYVLGEELKILEKASIDWKGALEKLVSDYKGIVTDMSAFVKPKQQNTVKHQMSIIKVDDYRDLRENLEITNGILTSFSSLYDPSVLLKYRELFHKTLFMTEELLELEGLIVDARARYGKEKDELVIPESSEKIDVLVERIKDHIEAVERLYNLNNSIVEKESTMQRFLIKIQKLEHELTLKIEKESSADNPAFKKYKSAVAKKHQAEYERDAKSRKLAKAQAQVFKLETKIQDLRDEKHQINFAIEQNRKNLERKQRMASLIKSRVEKQLSSPVLGNLLPKVLIDGKEGWSALDQFTQIYMTPEELELQLSNITNQNPLLKRNALALNMINRALSITRVEIDIIKSTRSLKYFVKNITRDFEKGRFDKPSGATEPLFCIYDWITELKSLTEPESDPAKVLKWIEPFAKSPKLFGRLLKYSLAILVTLPREKLNTKSFKDSLKRAEELNSEALKLFEYFEAEWKTGVFRESIVSSEPSEIIALIKEANALVDSSLVKDYLKVPINYLMNQAYAENGKKTEKKGVLTLLAAIIVRQHDEGDLPTSTLIRYYIETKKVVKEPAEVKTDDGFHIEQATAKVLKATADQIVADSLRGQKQLWKLESGSATEIKRLVQNPPEGRSSQEISNLVGIAYKSNVVEVMHKPQEYHDPKYWLNKYYACMEQKLPNCQAYFCAAGMSKSPLQDVTLVHCYDFIKDLKVHPSKSPDEIMEKLPDKGTAKYFIYRALKIEMAKMRDTNGFMKKFMKMAELLYKPKAIVGTPRG